MKNNKQKKRVISFASKVICSLIVLLTITFTFADEIVVSQPELTVLDGNNNEIENIPDNLIKTTLNETREPQKTDMLKPSVEKKPLTDEEIAHKIRVKKLSRIVQTFGGTFKNGKNDAGWTPELVEFFITEHEKYGKGFASVWIYSISYSLSNFGLQCGSRAPGRCYGPMDVKAPIPQYRRNACLPLINSMWPNSSRYDYLLRNPKVNIRCHVLEAYGMYQRGYRGIRIMEAVFYPAAPRDWGGGKIHKAYNKVVKCIKEGYRVGKL